MSKANDEKGIKETAENSLCLRALNRFIVCFYFNLANGVFGKLFTSYTRTENLFAESYVYKRLKGIGFFQKASGNLKRSAAHSFENSRIINAVLKFFSRLLSCRLKEYGAFFSVTGLCGLAVYAFRLESFEMLYGNLSGLLTCTVLIVFGVACAVNKKRVSEAFFESHMLSALLFEGLGIRKDRLNVGETGGNPYAFPIIFGMVFGVLTYAVDPLFYILFFLLILAAVLVILFPELGVWALFAVIPFAVYFPHPSFAILGTVAVTAVSYCVKLARGKRVFKLKFIDLVVFFFGVLILLSGIFSAGGKASLGQAALYFALLMSYFPAVNLVRSREWVKRASVTLVTFSAFAAVVGFFQFFGGGFESGWLDSSDFSGITVRITSTFENPNVYASYLLLVIPFALSELLKSRTPKKSVFCAVTLLLSAFCVIQTWSRGAWLGLCISLVLYFLMYSAKSLPYIAFGGALGALGVSFFSPNVSKRFMSIGNLSDTSVSYRISAWRGILKMLRSDWFGGIGFGESAFLNLYPMFAYSGATAVRHAHSLYLQIVTEMGIVGLLVFLAIVLLFAQNCFEYLFRLGRGYGRETVIAGISALCGVMIMGVTDYVWYNSRVFLAFWLVIALVNAHIRVAFEDAERLSERERNTEYAAAVEIDPNNL